MQKTGTFSNKVPDRFAPNALLIDGPVWGDFNKEAPVLFRFLLNYRVFLWERGTLKEHCSRIHKSARRFH